MRSWSIRSRRRATTPSALFAAVVLNALILFAAICWLPGGGCRTSPRSCRRFAYFVVIALLREADGGGRSAYSVLAMLPVFWLALYGTRRQLAAEHRRRRRALPDAAPARRRRPSTRPASGRAALLWICVAPIVGFTVQSLVRQLRERAAENLKRAEELQVSQEETRKLVVSMAAVTEATREIARTTDSTSPAR